MEPKTDTNTKTARQLYEALPPQNKAMLDAAVNMILSMITSVAIASQSDRKAENQTNN